MTIFYIQTWNLFHSILLEFLVKTLVCVHVCFCDLSLCPYMELFKKRGSTEVVLPEIQFTCLNKT